MDNHTTIGNWLKGTDCTQIIFFTSEVEGNTAWSGLPNNTLLTIEEAKPWLEIRFRTGFGGQQCPNFYAWSKTHVYFVHEYDGSVSLNSVPRNP